MLLNNNATVTVCHSQTKNISDIVRTADILVAAVGSAAMVLNASTFLICDQIKQDWVKPGAICLDVGTNSIEDPTKKSGRRLVGDIDFPNVVKVFQIGFFYNLPRWLVALLPYQEA